MIYNYKEKLEYKEKLIDAFIKINEFFDPTLIQRISSKNENHSIDDYINKLNENGDVFLFIENETVLGVGAVYTNDFEYNIAFIPLLFVLPDYKGRGIASKLLLQIKNHSHENKMKSIRVNTWKDNNNAISLYIKNGYKIIKLENSNVKFCMNLL